MTEPLITLEPSQLTVEPGAQVRATITVRNLGSVVEGYRLTVIDELGGSGPAAWARIAPLAAVYPQEQASTELVFAPPPGRGAPSGRFAFAVRATSQVDETVSVAVEGELEIGRLLGLQAKLTPLTSTGRWGGRHTVRLTNWGNSTVRLRLTAEDPDERLGFLIKPAAVELPLGGTAVCLLKVRSRRPFLRGTPVRLPFQVTVDSSVPPPATAPGRAPAPMPGDPNRPVLDGALLQKPILSRATVAIAGIAVAALAGGLVYAVKHGPTLGSGPSAGAPDPPTGLYAVWTPEGRALLTWKAVPNVDSYKLTSSPEIKEEPAFSGPMKLTDVLPAGVVKYCFWLRSIRGTATSVLSTKYCLSTSDRQSTAPTSVPPISTQPASPSPVVPGSPFLPGEFILWFGDGLPDTYLQTDLNAHLRAVAEQERLDLNPLGVLLLDSSDPKYPKLLVYQTPTSVSHPQPLWMLYLRGAQPWMHQQDVGDDPCQKVGPHKFCVLVQPIPVS